MKRAIIKLIKKIHKKSGDYIQKSQSESGEDILKIMLVAFNEGLKSGICKPLDEMEYDSQQLMVRVYFNTPMNHATIELDGTPGTYKDPLFKYDVTPAEVIEIFNKVRRGEL